MFYIRCIGILFWLLGSLINMAIEKRIIAPAGFPYFGWTHDSVKEYITTNPLSVGDSMIIYNGQGGLHSYSLALVMSPASGPQRRVILSKAGTYGGTSFHRSGKNCYSPKSQTRLLPPIPELMQHLGPDCDILLNTLPYSQST